MKTLQEILGDELYTQVQEKVKGEADAIVIVDSKKTPLFIPKTRFDEVNEHKKMYKDENNKLTKSLEDLQAKMKDTEGVSAELETLKTQVLEANSKVVEAEKQAEVKIKEAKLDSAVQVALASAQAKNATIVSTLIDRTKLEITESGEIKGLSEQVEAIKAKEAYLFEPVQAPSNPPPGQGTGTIGGGKQGDDNNKETIGAMLAKKRAGQANQSQTSFFA